MIALYWILVTVMVVGIIGAIMPGIPGVSLIVAAIVIWGVIHGFTGLSLPLGVANSYNVPSTEMCRLFFCKSGTASLAKK